MDNSVVIVALPSVNDRVQQISSEKVPHLTLVYMSNAGLDLQTVIEHVQHASRELSPFGLTVDHRGTLGEDEADVLFFEKAREPWDFGRIAAFRHHLLLNDAIRRGYDKAEQFPEWTPHLTLGYPATPAKPDDSDYPGIGHVQFDRIAVWTEDYDGPEFRLKYDDDIMEVAMSDMSSSILHGEDAVNELFHYGTKGMKWGVRKLETHRETAARSQRIADGTASGKDKFQQVMGKGQSGRGGLLSINKKIAAKQAARSTKKADKLEAKLEAKTAAKVNEKIGKADKASQKAAREAWKKEASSPEMANKVFQKAAKDFEKTAEIINNDANYKGKDVTKGILAKQYQATMNHYFNQQLAQASVDLTTNDQGRAYIYEFDAARGMMRGREYQAVLHADSGNMPDYDVELDELGHMVGFAPILDVKHYGVKGMKWGIRTTDRATQPTLKREKPMRIMNAKDVTVTQRKPGTFVKTRGGQRQKASNDAVRAHAGRQKAKKSTTDALTNDELKTSIERMKLEQEFSKLDSKVKRRGESFVQKLFASPEARQTTSDLLKRVAANAAG